MSAAFNENPFVVFSYRNERLQQTVLISEFDK